jgi:ribosomal protein L39E
VLVLENKNTKQAIEKINKATKNSNNSVPEWLVLPTKEMKISKNLDKKKW